MLPHSALIIGCGSIGERHLRCFLQTGRTRVTACDTNPTLLERIASTYRVPTKSDAAAAMAGPDCDAVVICTPAPLHIPFALKALAAGKHVLIEKPLSHSLAGLDELFAARATSGRQVAVAYVLHVYPFLLAAREFLARGDFGPVLQATANCGQPFHVFRPAYAQTYYRDHATGGGAIQDALTHMANAIEWVVGPTSRVYCDAAHQVLEGVEVEDTVNVVARNGATMVNYALTQFQAVNETRWDFHADTGSVRVELNQQRWGRMARGETDWTWTAAPIAERDQLFVAQANAFLDGCEGKPNLLCTLEEGARTLRFNLAALQSWRENRPITL